MTVCRQEGGAVMMAEAHGKLTGRPGIAFVTRGPGATNGSPGIHIAKQDSTPLIMFVPLYIFFEGTALLLKLMKR